MDMSSYWAVPVDVSSYWAVPVDMSSYWAVPVDVSSCWAVPVYMSSCWAISSTVILLSARIKSLTACCFSGVFISEGLPCLGSSLMLVRPSLNLAIHLYTFFGSNSYSHNGQTFFYRLHFVTPSAARNLITALCSSCVASSRGKPSKKN